MNSPLNIFSSGKLAGRASRWRLAVAVGTAAAIGASAVAVATPARADDVDQTCVTYHSWTVCVSHDWTTGKTAVNGMNTGNAGLHSLFMNLYGDVYSSAHNFTAGQWYGFAENSVPIGSEKVWGGIDSTTIVGQYF